MPEAETLVNANAASATLALVRLPMDEYAKEIFDLWFEGKAPREVTFNTSKWADYMRAEPQLQRQIEYQLRAYAETIRDEVDRHSGYLFRPFTRKFHAQVGSDSGGYTTGYEILHGTNKAVGDFLINGTLIASRMGPPTSAYTVTYQALKFAFNDIVDVNKRWNSDITTAKIATNLARALNIGPPKDYILHIIWNGIGPTVRVSAFTKGQAPSWLKTFRNR